MSESEITGEDEHSSPPREQLSRNLPIKYELGKLLGVGAFGKVYHARDLFTGHSVAIKSFSKHCIFKENLMAKIEREISIMRRLSHPNIVLLQEVLAIKTKIYFVMEYAKGGELYTKLPKGRFSEDLSRKYFQQLISAVSYCHARGVFHRDLKPENLLLDDNWQLKVTDFGLSALTDQIRPDGLLHTLCGTPAYVAPEVLANKGYDGAKIDIWSCGIILYVLNAGYLPFNDANLMAMYRKIYKAQFRCPNWTSPDLKRLLTRILEPNPTTRITVQEIVNDPWFSKGYEKINYPVPREYEFKDSEKETRFLNAFELIAYSSGAHLSGLFSNSGNRVKCEMFVSTESPDRIIEKIEELAKEGCASVAKKGMGVRLLGPNGNFVLMVEINRLTEELVVVEVKRDGFGPDVWKDTFLPRLSDVVHGPKQAVTGK